MAEHKRSDRIVDVASVVLISVAAVLTALCSYQSGRWGGQQARLYSLASADHMRSVSESDRANTLTAIDVGVFLRYMDAVVSGDKRMTEFLHRRMRPEMQPAMRAWLATNPLQNLHAPASPFTMQQYSLRSRSDANRWDAQGRREYEEAIDANRHSDDFLLLTVIFAAVSFLAGISTKMAYPRHAIVVALAAVATIYGFVRLVSLPFL
ncbi:MAG: hypothetical protein JOZ77_08390 [Candidatus Eremiobacteraeota bacterium]|nr:hypothetical protein [Candidatus Eremiobacteraeota bacterium]